MMQRNEKSMGTDERPEPNAESGSSASPARGDIVDTSWDIPPISFDENDGGIAQGDNGTGTVAGGVQSVFPSFDEVLEWPTASAANTALRNQPQHQSGERNAHPAGAWNQDRKSVV